MFRKIFFSSAVCFILIFMGLFVFRHSKNSDNQRHSTAGMSESLSSSTGGLVPNFKPWVDNPVPELKPRRGSPFSGLVSLTEYPMPSLTPGFALRDQRLLYWYPRKLREDWEVSIDEVEAVFIEKFPVQFKIKKKFWYKTARVYVGYISSFPRVPFNKCTKVDFVLSVGRYSGRQDLGGNFLPDHIVSMYLHTNDFEASTPSNILLARRNLDSCFGDTTQSQDMRFQEYSWLRDKFFTLMPDRPLGYG